MFKRASLASVFSAMLVTGSLPAHAAVRPDATVGGNQTEALLPIGQFITPTVTPGSTLQQLTTGVRPDGTADANGGISTTLSPDGKTLLVLTSGYNAHFFTTGGQPALVPFLNPTTGVPSNTTTNSFQWVLVYDVSRGRPVQKQRIALPSSFDGIAWDPKGTRFYVSGGQDDRVYIYALGAATRRVTREITMPGLSSDSGQYPLWVTPHAGPSGATDKLYVSCLRQGQIVVFGASGMRRVINLGGGPGKSVLSRDGSRLYVANPDLDAIDVISTATDTVSR